MNYANGQLPPSELSNIPGGRLRKGATARSWLAMRYRIGRETGIWLRPTGPNASYRTLVKQQEFYAAYKSGRGPLAAVPSTSNHGWARAVDIPTEQMQSAARRYAHLYGWGVAGGRLPSDAPTEPWHMRFNGISSPAMALRVRRDYWRYRKAQRRNK